jgi:hypothetical protein
MTAAGAVRVERWLYKDRRNPEANALGDWCFLIATGRRV